MRGGGCSGFQYALALDQQKDEDHVFEHQGVAVVVDKVSMQFVFGSEVDYVDGLQGAGFVVNNPNISLPDPTIRNIRIYAGFDEGPPKKKVAETQ